MKNMNKHILKLTKKVSKTRPILNSVNYDSETNTINVTDSMRLISIKSEEKINNTFNIDPTSMMNKNIDYPNVHRLIPSKQEDYFEVLMSIDHKSVTSLLKTNKKSYSKILIKDEYLVLAFDNNGIEIPITLGKTEESSKDIGYFNNEFLCDLFDFIKDADYLNKTVKMNHINTLKPLALSFDEEYIYLITPVRV